MGRDVPKAFLPLAGKPLLVHTLTAIERSPVVGAGIMVATPGRQRESRELLRRHGPFRLDWLVVDGGEERQDSVRLGLAQIDEDCEIVIVHDGARPFVRAELIAQVVEAAAAGGGAVAAIAASDTVKRVSPDGRVTETLARTDLRLAQTPQAFRTDLIRRAHAWAHGAGVRATDDAALVEAVGGRVQVIDGDPCNIKITTPADLLLAEAIVRAGAAG